MHGRFGGGGTWMLAALWASNNQNANNFATTPEPFGVAPIASSKLQQKWTSWSFPKFSNWAKIHSVSKKTKDSVFALARNRRMEIVPTTPPDSCWVKFYCTHWQVLVKIGVGTCWWNQNISKTTHSQWKAAQTSWQESTDMRKWALDVLILATLQNHEANQPMELDNNGGIEDGDDVSASTKTQFIFFPTVLLTKLFVSPNTPYSPHNNDQFCLLQWQVFKWWIIQEWLQ